MAGLFKSRASVVKVPNITRLAIREIRPTGKAGKLFIKRVERVELYAKRYAPRRTGALAASIHANFHWDTLVPFAVVSSDLRYSEMVEEGTKPHRIAARPGKYLRFMGRNRSMVFVTEVLHPGTQGTHYLSKALARVFKV
jgi:hypothetical protein